MAHLDHDDPPRQISLNTQREQDASSDSESDDAALAVPSSHDVGSGIDIEAIKSAKRVEHTIAHRVEAERSILALVVDDEYLFAGLEGGEITVGIWFYVSKFHQVRPITNESRLTIGVMIGVVTRDLREGLHSSCPRGKRIELVLIG
jgi:hypothetical protein